MFVCVHDSKKSIAYFEGFCCAYLMTTFLQKIIGFLCVYLLGQGDPARATQPRPTTGLSPHHPMTPKASFIDFAICPSRNTLVPGSPFPGHPDPIPIVYYSGTCVIRGPFRLLQAHGVGSTIGLFMVG